MPKKKQLSRRQKSTEIGSLSDLPGLGAYSQKMLQKANIHSLADLQRFGPVGAFTAVIEAGEKPSLNLLWGIAGALSNTHWTKLPADYRSALLLEYDAWRDRRGR